MAEEPMVAPGQAVAIAPVLLGFDTCGPNGSVALARAGGDSVEILRTAELPGRSYSARLISAIRDLLAEARLPLRQLAAVVVTSGPGSFTGVRVGLSAAKGLAEGASLPVLAVSRLAVLAHASHLAHSLVILDAGRGEYYAGEYRSAGGDELACMREALFSEAEVRAAAESGLRLVVCEERPAEQFCALGPLAISAPTAADALRLAVPRFHLRQFEDVEALDANYLRRSDAELFGKPGR